MSNTLKLSKAGQLFSDIPANAGQLLDADIAPSGCGTTYRVTVSLPRRAILTLRIKDIEVGSGTIGIKRHAMLNGGTPLDAGVLYTFTFGVRKEFSYNLLTDIITAVDYLTVEEITGAVT